MLGRELLVTGRAGWVFFSVREGGSGGTVPVLSQRDQALGALKAWVQVLGPEVRSQVVGVGGGVVAPVTSLSCPCHPHACGDGGPPA